MLTDLLILLALILLNGAFAMSEIAIVSAKRARLVQLAESGRGARVALELAAEPTRFLSSVQVGITSIGILSGAIGEASIAGPLRAAIGQVPALAPYAEGLALAVMVVGLSYASLILGELAPKRLALTDPERIASLVARPMRVVARVGRPVVHLLSASTDAFLRLLRVRHVKRPAVTLEELKVLLEQATEEGVFEPAEREMVTNVLNLDDRHVGRVLTPRRDIVFLDLRDTPEATLARLREGAHTVMPLCDGGLDHVVGVVRLKGLIEQLLDGRPLELASAVEPALFVPETASLMQLVEQFKRARLPVALVVGEFGEVEGMISLDDVLTAIVGELPAEPGEEPSVVRREDGSWLLDGALDLDVVQRVLETEDLLDAEERRQYHTLGGLVMFALGRVPRTGETFEHRGHRFEVVDMDGHRVDRVLVARTPER